MILPSPNIASNPKARIADVQCCRYVPMPGDRLIVRLYQKLDSEARKKLRKTVEKWAGEAEVLWVDCTVFDVEIEKSKGIIG